MNPCQRWANVRDSVALGWENGGAISTASEVARATAARRPPDLANHYEGVTSMDSVPAVPTSVYQYRDVFGILIYVGITSRGQRRQDEHNATKEWWPLVASQEVEHFATRPEATARERDLIVRHMPPFNHQHNRHQADSLAAYQEFMASQSGRGVPLPQAIAARPEKRIELECHSVIGETLAFRTRASDAQIGMALELDKPVRAYGIPSRATNINRIVKRGPFAMLYGTRLHKWPLLDAYAVIYCDQKRPLSVARLRTVQIRVDHEAVA